MSKRKKNKCRLSLLLSPDSAAAAERLAKADNRSVNNYVETLLGRVARGEIRIVAPEPETHEVAA